MGNLMYVTVTRCMSQPSFSAVATESAIIRVTVELEITVQFLGIHMKRSE